MPRIGMEPIRRKALIEAAIETIGAQGNLHVTMSQIARSAGVSPALAHHYFGGKEQLFLATMRHLMDEFGGGVRDALRGSGAPRARISGIIGQSFRPEQFEPATVAAWLAFYVWRRATNRRGGCCRFTPGGCIPTLSTRWRGLHQRMMRSASPRA